MPQHQQTQAAHAVKIKGETIRDENQLKEHGEGFQAREKINRTPPEEEGQRYRGPQTAHEEYMAQYYSQEGSLSPIQRQIQGSNSNQSLPYRQQQPSLLNQPPAAPNQLYIYQQQQNQRTSIQSLGGGGLDQAIQDSRIGQQPPQKGIVMERVKHNWRPSALTDITYSKLFFRKLYLQILIIIFHI